MNMKGSYRTADGRAQIDWTLEEKPKGLTFSACGDYRHPDGGHSGGQCIDTIAEAYPDDPIVQSMAAVWERWHLNDMQAGCVHQRALGWDNKQLSKPCPTCGYKYGSAWLHEPIPPEVVEVIQGWDQAPLEDLSEYQAREFLRVHGLKLEIKEGEGKAAPWDGPSGQHYRIKIKSATGRRALAFDFWGSQADQEERRELKPGSVLACIAHDTEDPGDIDEFSENAGNGLKPSELLRTWKRCREFAAKLQAFFTERELEELRGIE